MKGKGLKCPWKIKLEIGNWKILILHNGAMRYNCVGSLEKGQSLFCLTAQSGAIALCHWKWTTENWNFGMMWRHRSALLKNNNWENTLWRDAVSIVVTHWKRTMWNWPSPRHGLIVLGYYFALKCHNFLLEYWISEKISIIRKLIQFTITWWVFRWIILSIIKICLFEVV